MYSVVVVACVRLWVSFPVLRGAGGGGKKRKRTGLEGKTEPSKWASERDS